MKKYNVYGIGNALVDMEFKIDENFLNKMNVEKGVMTLVDSNRQDELLSELSTGEVERACGGSAANSVIAVSQFGGQSFYSCKVANDEFGDFYAADLKSNGVETNLHKERESGVTGKCMVMVTPDADRTMNTFLGITETFAYDQIIPEELTNSEYLYIEGYLVTAPNARAAAIKAREFAVANGVKTSMTFSDLSMVLYFKEGLVEMLGPNGVDLLFCNEDEALKFTETEDIKVAADKMMEYARKVVITRGPKGAFIYDGTNTVEVGAPSVEAIDTNGAGDLFAGAFLYGTTHNMSDEDCAKLATEAASTLVTQFGPRLTAQQSQDIKGKLFS
jgi:sugar/nucleoside kinase (ribokinase family)